MYNINSENCNTHYGSLKRPILHMTQDPEIILYNIPDEHKNICHNNIVSLEVVRGVNKFYGIDHSGFSLVNGTLKVSQLYALQ